MFVFVLIVITLCPFKLLNHLQEEFAIILKKKRKLVALLLLSYRCIVSLNEMWLFLTVPYVGLQYVIVVFPDHTHLLLLQESFFPV